MTRKHESVNKIERIQISELKPYDKNPRKHDKSLPELIKSIEQFGFTQPIVIDQNNRIVAGHGRYQACLKLNRSAVPCVRVELTDHEYHKLMLADNKITELSKWDKNLLKECMEILGDIQSIEVPAFSNDEIDKIFGHKHVDVSSTKEVDEADFGGGVKVTSESDDRALVKRKTFMFTQKEYKYVTDKLKAIKKEHGLDTEAEAFIKALEPYKGLTKVKRSPGPVKEVSDV